MLLAAAIMTAETNADIRGSAHYAVSAETLDAGGRLTASLQYRAGGSVASGPLQAASGGDYAFANGFLPAVDLPGPPPPTAAGLAFFRAEWQLDEAVLVSWQSLVEVRLLGYRLERSVQGGDWERVGAGLIPAQGMAQPHLYAIRLEGLSADARYRLVEIDLQGQERVASEVAMSSPIQVRLRRTPEGLGLEFFGPPQLQLAVEAAGAVAGPWSKVVTLALDEAGRGAATIGLDETGRARFFRAVAP